MSNKRILVIGATPKYQSKEGGCTVLLQNLIDYGLSHDIDMVQLHTYRYKNKLLNMIYFIFMFLFNLFRCKYVMYNASLNGAFVLFYYTAPIALFFKRKVVFRKFGGSFHQQLDAVGHKKRKRMLNLLGRSSVAFFETKDVVTYMRSVLPDSVKVEWFSNSRFAPNRIRSRAYGRKFVYVSHIYEEKGIDHLLHLSDELPEDFSIDIYGIVKEKKYTNEYLSCHKAVFHGLLRMDEVTDTLREYDFLVLPTYCSTEGYPGIILEAYSVGLPVVASRIGGIPEIVKNGETGVLIEPNNYKSLKQCILNLTADDCDRMSEAALKEFNLYFNSDNVNRNAFELIFKS